MIRVVIRDNQGTQWTFASEGDEIVIGRVTQKVRDEIVLPKKNISRKHCRIFRDGDDVMVEDMGSVNGTWVNREKLNGAKVLSLSDKVHVGDYVLSMEDEAEAADAPVPPPPGDAPAPPPPAPPAPPSAPAAPPAPPAPPVPASPPAPPAPPAPAVLEPSDESSDEDELSEADVEAEIDEPVAPPPPPAPPSAPAPPAPPAPPSAPPTPPAPPSAPPAPPAPTAKTKVPAKSKAKEKAKPAPVSAPEPDPVDDEAVNVEARLRQELHDRLIRVLDLRTLEMEELEEEALRERSRDAIVAIIDEMDAAGEWDETLDRDRIVRDVLDEVHGLGPLEEFLADDSVTEVMVNHPRQIYVERNGRLERANRIFSSDRAVLQAIERIVAPLGRRIDQSSPMVDARLHDGSRVNAIIPPLAIRGPSITIRKFAKERMTVEDLIRLGTLSKEMAEFLRQAVVNRRNLVISGGTGSGKTTTLNILSSYIPASERIVTIEDAAELQLPQDHVVSLESRPPNLEGKGAIAIRDLVKNSLRMRPDRIVVGECRGGETLDMLQAMNTGHDGSLTTLHANAPRDALSRLETMVLMSGMELPVRAIREQVSSAVDIIVQQSRLSDGSRRITHISEVLGMEVDIITLADIFVFKQSGIKKDGTVEGELKPTGLVPRFYQELKDRGLPVDMSIFGD
jgi:pilus assembly protein CpaF